jgi:cation:H+ antiporter
MLYDSGLVVVGLLALLFGGDALVRGAVALAQRAGLSPLVIGLTLVGFGTSVPELLTSVYAALDGLPGIAFGNVVGSNIANILLILGVAAIIAPFGAKPVIGRDGWWMLGATAACIAIIMTGQVGLLAGLAGVTALAVYIMIVLRQPEAAENVLDDIPRDVPSSPWLAMVTFLAGLVGVVLGAKFLVDGASGIARIFAVSEAVIGLTIVAIGTSLPELVTSVIAARKGHADLALGNVIGSNIFNILGILGITVVIQPMVVPPEMLGSDMWVFAGSALALVAVAAVWGKVGRTAGVVFVGAYIAFLVSLFPWS